MLDNGYELDMSNAVNENCLRDENMKIIHDKAQTSIRQFTGKFMNVTGYMNGYQNRNSQFHRKINSEESFQSKIPNHKSTTN